MEKIKFTRKQIVGEFEPARASGHGEFKGLYSNVEVGDEFEVTLRGVVTKLEMNKFVGTTRFSFDTLED